MKAVTLAILTAVLWSVGGFFEKKGLNMGGIPPVAGITMRTFIALIVLSLFSFTKWGSVSSCGIKPLLYIIIGGGVIAGSFGMLCFYMGISTGHLSRVIPIAFGLTPVLGYVLGTILLKEPVTLVNITGLIFTSLGVILIGMK
ncbi:MAG: EamA family transporter [Armatimonadota bacterium]